MGNVVVYVDGVPQYGEVAEKAEGAPMLLS